MRIVCPCCQADFPIEAGLNDVEARNAIKRAFSLSPIGAQLLFYLQLFKPAKQAMRMDKFARLLNELVDMIHAGKIMHNGAFYSAPQKYWELAINQMLDNRQQLKLPMKSHGYLISIIAGYAEKEEAKVEKQTEARRISGVAKDDTPLEKKASTMPDDVRQQLQQYRTTKTNQYQQPTTGENDVNN